VIGHDLKSASGPSTPGTIWILRFDRVERAAHWANALLFTILMATSLPLYFAQIEAHVGRRALLVEIHVWSGVALPIPLIISLAGSWGARFRRDLRRINLWTTQEIHWLWSARDRGRLKADKFNPGQKLNAIFTGAVIVIMLGSGSILKWLRFFPLSWRTGATFVHDVFAFAIFAVVFGHIFMALTHPDALRSIFKGKVTTTWAKRHAAAWLEEVQEDEPHSGPAPGP
jgi:formate dehydrogenase subunit gamma